MPPLFSLSPHLLRMYRGEFDTGNSMVEMRETLFECADSGLGCRVTAAEGKNTELAETSVLRMQRKKEIERGGLCFFAICDAMDTALGGLLH